MRILLAAALGVALAGCADMSAPVADAPFDAPDAPELPATPLSYVITGVPSALLNDPVVRLIDPPDNPITNAGATLGRVLFYDRRLSRDGTVSCASCHHQSASFTDTARVSRGVGGALGERNSMPIVNIAWVPTLQPAGQPRFLWDTRATSLEQQVLLAIENPHEMAMAPDSLAARLSAVAWYPALFEQAFGSRAITTDRIAKAIVQFERSMVSTRSRHDSAQAVSFTTLTPLETEGRRLFNDGSRLNCASCHAGPQFQNSVPVNIGLDATTTDRGVGAVTGLPQDDGRFRVPKLRNIAVTGPYMHDGRFATLEQVLQFYSQRIQPHPNLAAQLRAPGGLPRRPNYTPEEIAALIAYLRTLTDHAFLTDERFSDPFRRR